MLHVNITDVINIIQSIIPTMLSISLHSIAITIDIESKKHIKCLDCILCILWLRYLGRNMLPLMTSLEKLVVSEI